MPIHCFLFEIQIIKNGFTGPMSRVWKGFCAIRDSAEIELVIREYRKKKKKTAVIHEFCIGCDAGFSLPVVRDS